MLVFASSCTTSDSPGELADDTADSGVTVVINAQIYTVDTNHPWVDAFAFGADGIIIAVGSESDVLAAAGEGAATIDADGSMILPGFQDPHVHVPEAGINAELCFMSGQDLNRLETQARSCAEREPDEEWVRSRRP